MGKPTAKVIAMTQYHKILQEYHQENVYLLKEPDSQVLCFSGIKHYSSADLVLKSKQKNIHSKGLIHFLKTLGIALEIAQGYFHEVCVYNKQTREKLKTLGFPNEDEGFELINPFFRGTIGTQSISFIRGTTPKPESIHVFKDSLDFLSFLSKLGGKKILADAIVLHSTNCLEQVKPYIQNYGYKQVCSWMSNDKTGQEAKACIQHLVSSEKELKHKAMNALYAPKKDLSKWYQQQVRNSQ